MEKEQSNVKRFPANPELDVGSQSMLFKEEICRFMRQKLALVNIRVETRTYID